MNLVIDLNPELEAVLRKEAANAGMDASTFAIRTLEEQIYRRVSRQARFPRLNREETLLLTRINKGWPEAKWQHYSELVGKRRAETLTESEQQELIALGDDLEAWNVKRLRNLIKLSSLRGISVEALMQELGIKPRNV